MKMSPGGRIDSFGGRKYSLDDGALTDSLALAIEQEFSAVYQGVKNEPLPPTARQDMRLIWVGIARGVLKYLNAHQTANIIAQPNQPSVNHQHQVTFDVDLT